MANDTLMSIRDLKTVDEEVKRELRDDIPILNELHAFLWHEKNASDDPWRSSGYYSPSSLAYCARAMYYQRTEVEQRNCLEAQTRITFGVGHAVHDMLQSWLVEALGEDAVEMEVVCTDEDLHIKGAADGLLELEHFRKLLEIKTISAKGYADLSKPKPEHVLQTHCYAYMLDTPLIDYIYVSKEWPHEIKVFSTFFDRVVWGKARDKLESIEACVQAENPPPQEVGRGCWECKFRWHCEPDL
jgi:CRISPR/Cas system-associated exonuclease Cas4 (RecB family)